MATPDATIVVPSSSLPPQQWWPDLHSTIITAFLRKDIQAFRPTWTRLNPDPATGAEGLANELRPHGELVVIFRYGKPVACSGVEPFRGVDWIKDALNANSDAKVANGELTELGPQPGAKGVIGVLADWEICCFCVHLSHRGSGLARLLLQAVLDTVKSKGASSIVANYSTEATGDFWFRMGFTQPLGSGSVAKKGWTHTPGMEGLRADIHFKMSAMTLR